MITIMILTLKNGHVAEWLRRGLQILLSQFDSGRGLQNDQYFMIDKEIFKTASNNKDYGHLDNYSHYSNSKSSTCGDNIKSPEAIRLKQVATWRNGYAEDCKSLYPGSIPGVTSKKKSCFNLKKK